MKHFLSFSAVLLSLPAVLGQDDYSIVSAETSLVPITQDAQYSCDFINLWNSTRLPNQYPSDAQWSPPVMATHNSGYEMWDVGPR